MTQQQLQKFFGKVLLFSCVYIGFLIAFSNAVLVQKINLNPVATNITVYFSIIFTTLFPLLLTGIKGEK